MKKKVLFVATVVKTHIMVFHLPFLKWFQEQGYETYVAAKNDYADPTQCVIPYCDHYINIEFSRNPISNQNLAAYKQLKNLIDTENFSIIHCHTPVGGVLARLAARNARKQGTKVIYTAHGFHFYTGAPLQNWLIYYPVERFCAHYTDTLITINQEDYNRAKKFACKDIRLVNGVGIDLKKIQSCKTDRNAMREQLGIPENAFVILSVGELIKRKNHQMLIKIMNKLKDDNIYCLICGSGRDFDELKELIHQSKLDKQVKLLGFRNDVIALYETSDLFVFPSLQEGLPVAVMEAMACGKPCIVSDIRGNHDLIQNEKGGYLVQQNVEEYEQRIYDLLEDPYKRTEFGTYNKKKIMEYSLVNVINQMNKIYRKYM